ncbi:glucoamylase [Jimgerdemannia flammicorona]|uniref:glucan 1,4-alpha-glucosidase n=1 Tax=Jimgerdemannia flammicorona TaxID=994334 RepID=A0A433CVV8_9FUNG|nr:glucoamylase [Jimgerdemannia flammicorona]
MVSIKFSLIAVCLAAATTNAQLASWITNETSIAYTKMYANIQPSGTVSGCVIASPSKSNPDYYYHWVRDAAMTMKVVVDQYNTTRAGDSTLVSMLKNFVTFSRTGQTEYTRCGCLGEPKFHVDGTSYTGDWGRPQNDGPAIRATALIKFAYSYIAQTGDVAYVKSKLYDSALPTYSVIKADLEYVAHNWQSTCFDLWEEVTGLHFFTLMVQRRALIEGAAFANYLGDTGAGTSYLQQAASILTSLNTFWDSSNGLIQTSLSSSSSKTSGLDTAQILGVLHGYANDGQFSPNNDKLLATTYLLKQRFQNLYPINYNNPTYATAIGRYPEDVYNGVGTSQGNPWILCTAAFAELYYKAAITYNQDGKIYVTSNNLNFLKQFYSSATSGAIYSSGSTEFTTIINGLNAGGDAFLNTIKWHANTDGSLGEEWDRTRGYNTGAADLTWSYASFITASLARAGTPAF